MAVLGTAYSIPRVRWNKASNYHRKILGYYVVNPIDHQVWGDTAQYLLYDLKLGPVWGLGGTSIRGGIIGHITLFRKQHATAFFPGVDAKHGLSGHEEILGHSAKAGIEANHLDVLGVVPQLDLPSNPSGLIAKACCPMSTYQVFG
jgi:hypothetical protein